VGVSVAKSSGRCDTWHAYMKRADFDSMDFGVVGQASRQSVPTKIRHRNSLTQCGKFVG